MTPIDKKISESDLQISLNELAHAIVREMTMTARKVAIYGPSHPAVTRAIGKPFEELNKAFRFRRTVNFNVDKGELYVLNVRQRESVFSEELLRFLKILDIHCLSFERRLTVNELSGFLGRLVKRTIRGDHDNLMVSYLREAKIDSIEVNSDRVFAMIEESHHYRGDVEGDYSVKSIVMSLIGRDPGRLAALQTDLAIDDPFLEDFNPEVIQYLLPETVASLTSDEFMNSFRTSCEELKNKDIDGASDSTLKNLYHLLDYHPDRDLIVNELKPIIAQVDNSGRAIECVSSQTGTIKLEASEQVDQLVDQLLERAPRGEEQLQFKYAFGRLLRTGQRGKAVAIAGKFLDQLESSESFKRNRSLDLLLDAIDLIELPTHKEVFEQIVDISLKRLDESRETFEYSEYVWRLVEMSNRYRHFDIMARLVEALARRRTVTESVTIYDSIAVKQALSNVDRTEIINTLVDEMITGHKETAVLMRKILVAIGSEKVALALSSIISHPARAVRQQSLRILAELGKASLKVFGSLLSDDSLFAREAGRHELPEAKWYVVRNSIFVLGSLGDPAAASFLRLRLDDKDIRVRREMISALEKIGGDEACDLLLLMAEDRDREIGQRAIVATGLIGNADTAPLLFDLAHRHPTLAPRVLLSMGRIGGEEARRILLRLLANEDELIDLADGQVSREEIKLALVKALGMIGGAETIEGLRQFKDGLSRTQRVLFGKSAVNKAVSEILMREEA